MKKLLLIAMVFMCSCQTLVSERDATELANKRVEFTRDSMINVQLSEKTKRLSEETTILEAKVKNNEVVLDSFRFYVNSALKYKKQEDYYWALYSKNWQAKDGYKWNRYLDLKNKAMFTATSWQSKMQ